MSDIENNFQPCVCFAKLKQEDDYSRTVFSLVKSKQHKSSAVRSSETRQQVLYILICSMRGRQSYKMRPGNGSDIATLIYTVNKTTAPASFHCLFCWSPHAHCVR